MTEEFNFKNEIRKIPINSREEQIIKLVEENFDEAVRRLKKEVEDELQINTIRKNKEEFIDIFESAVDKFAGEQSK